MEEIIFYRAYDGTDFNDEYECRYYEWSSNIKDNAGLPLMLLNGNYQPLRLDETDSYDGAYFIFIGSEEAADFLADIWDIDMVDVYAPRFLRRYGGRKTGLWAYDESTEEWYHLGDKLAELQEMADRCMQAVNDDFGGV
jgi:hypothetical protein